MIRDKWTKALLKLQRNHASEIRLFHSDETYILTESNRLHRLELSNFTRPRDRAMIIRRQLETIKSLQQERKLRYQALMNRHSEELYDLMRLKILSTDVE